ncbi:WD40 repeat domain-containing serine/threonine-protein kinase [Crateriforma conspicua]|uniref:WD40 repeat domain-containing serine/threonine-protein kinase n=1 Tax=Crateriforma conspicua TaxID=2527996 RepID=UPI001188FFD1|nr:WD40 repeat domain-containing serine/threonine-protein kinase [Crateriforma conspicua]QDV61569.1 Serine/threonine-protein kinase PrkC [Crateriforma conspicua]
MTRSENKTLDEVIAAYLQRLESGHHLDPEEFVRPWPRHRDAFLGFIRRANPANSAGDTEAGDWSHTGTEPSLGGDAKDLTAHDNAAEPPSDPLLVSDESRSSSLTGDASTEIHVRSGRPDVVGEYRLERLIGRGGMARVYLGRRQSDQHPAAVKVLDAVAAADEVLVQRFRREASAIRSLDHPHIVPLLDFGSDDDASYLALKLIDGCTLADLVSAMRIADPRLQNEPDSEIQSGGLSTVGTMSVEMPSTSDGRDQGTGEASIHSGAMDGFRSDAMACFTASAKHGDRFQDIAEMIAVAADALQAAHDQGMVHRDVKPSNLMLDSTGHLWLTDFGLASLGEAHTVVTQTGQVIGTPHYMSPEQAVADQGQVDHRSDVYSLGATLYELVTGRRPHHGDRFRILMEISAGRFPPPSKVLPDVPRPLEAIILKAMQRMPSDRYQAAADMAADLRRFAAGTATVARTPGPADHAIRWVVSNPKAALAVATLTATIVLAVIAAQYLMGQRLARFNRELGTANETLERTNAALAKSNLDLDQSQRRLRRQLYVADVAAAYRAYDRGDFDAVEQLLDRHDPDRVGMAPGTYDPRGFEWRLLRTITHRPAPLRIEADPKGVTEIAVTSDGRQLVSVGNSGDVAIWSLADGPSYGQLIRRHPIGGRLDAIAVSPDAKWFVTGRNVPLGINSVQVHRMDDGELIRRLEGHGYSVESVAISADGQFVSTAGRYHKVKVHDAEGNVIGSGMAESRNESMAFAPDGETLLTAFRETDETTGDLVGYSIKMWPVSDMDAATKWRTELDSTSFAFSGDGRRIVVANNNDFAVYGWPDRKQWKHHRGIRGRLRCIALDHAGQHVAAGCDNGLVYVWDLNRPLDRPEVITASDRRITSIKFIDANTLAEGGEDGVIRIHRLNLSRQPFRSIGDPMINIAAVNPAATQVYTRLQEGGVQKYDLSTLEVTEVATDDDTQRNSIDVSSDGQWMAVGCQGRVVVQSVDDQSVIARLPIVGQPQEPDAVRFTNDNRYLLLLFDDHLRRYRTSDWTEQERVTGPSPGASRVITLDRQDRYLVVSQELLWWIDSETMRLVDQRPSQYGNYCSAALSASQELLAVGHHDGTIELLRTSDGSQRRLMRGHRDSVDGLCFIEDDQTLVSACSGGTLHFWDVRSGRDLGFLKFEHRQSDRLFFNEPLQRLMVFGFNYPCKVLAVDPLFAGDSFTAKAAPKTAMTPAPR